MNLSSIDEYVLRQIDDMEKSHLRSIDDKPLQTARPMLLLSNKICGQNM